MIQELLIQTNMGAKFSEELEIRRSKYKLILPDIVAQEQTIRVLRLVWLLALNCPEPPGVINYRSETITYA